MILLILLIFIIEAEYPSSSKKPKNWDKIAADVEAEEKDEKLEGDAALNKYFSFFLIPTSKFIKNKNFFHS